MFRNICFYIIRLYLVFCLLSLLWHWKAITVFLQTKRLNNYKKVKKSLAADVADLLSVSNLFTCFALERHLAWNIHLQGESEKHFEIKKKNQSRHIFAFCSLSGGAVGASCPSAFEWARVAGHCEVTAQPEREDKKSEVVFNRNCREEVEITLRCRQVRLTSDVFW